MFVALRVFNCSSYRRMVSRRPWTWLQTVSVGAARRYPSSLRLGEAASPCAAKGALESVARATPAWLIAGTFDLSLAALLAAVKTVSTMVQELEERQGVPYALADLELGVCVCEGAMVI